MIFWSLLTIATPYPSLACFGIDGRILQYVAVCCSVLQCVAVCCSVLQCVAVWSRSRFVIWIRMHSTTLQYVYVCMHIHICTYTRMYTYTYVHSVLQSGLEVDVQCKFWFILRFLLIHTYTCIYIYVHTHVCIYIYMYMVCCSLVSKSTRNIHFDSYYNSAICIRIYAYIYVYIRI